MKLTHIYSPSDSNSPAINFVFAYMCRFADLLQQLKLENIFYFDSRAFAAIIFFQNFVVCMFNLESPCMFSSRRH